MPALYWEKNRLRYWGLKKLKLYPVCVMIRRDCESQTLRYTPRPLEVSKYLLELLPRDLTSGIPSTRGLKRGLPKPSTVSRARPPPEEPPTAKDQDQPEP